MRIAQLLLVATVAASLLLPGAARAQSAPSTCTTLWDYVERMPTFAGGNAAIVAFLADHIIYPEAARRHKIEGKVFVKFVVDTTGQVQNPAVMKDLGYGCNDEAVRVVKLLPRFTPGWHNGRLVCVTYMVPVTFKLK